MYASTDKLPREPINSLARESFCYLENGREITGPAIFSGGLLKLKSRLLEKYTIFLDTDSEVGTFYRLFSVDVLDNVLYFLAGSILSWFLEPCIPSVTIIISIQI